MLAPSPLPSIDSMRTRLSMRSGSARGASRNRSRMRWLGSGYPHRSRSTSSGATCRRATADRLGEGGLRYLLEEGIHYNNAHHAHANTETIVGHVTLATGAHPAAHGMIGNIWFDRTTGVTTYNIEDADYRLLTEGADVDADTEIDPTQKAATSDGRSPMAILTTTFLRRTGRRSPAVRPRSSASRSRIGERCRWRAMPARPSGSPRRRTSS